MVISLEFVIFITKPKNNCLIKNWKVLLIVIVNDLDRITEILVIIQVFVCKMIRHCLSSIEY